MRQRVLFLSVLLVAFLSETSASAGAVGGNCRLGDQPAATLLFPYFELDLSEPQGSTTLLSINNAFAAPTLTRVVLWTDWGVPTLAFDVYLTGFDIQTINLRDLFQGKMPLTGIEISPRGSFSLPDPGHPDCEPSNSSGRLGLLEVAWLRAAHTGTPLPGSSPAFCASDEGRRVGWATGYVTVDVVNRCSPLSVGETRGTPADPAYFSAGGRGLASDVNTLWGDVIEVDRSGATASEAAVSIVADADFFNPGDYTFYGRYVGFDSRDDRIPLSSLYHARFLDGGGFGAETELVVWRDTREREPIPRACSTRPRWQPLGEAQIAVFDEEENPQRVSEGRAFPLATQKVKVGGAELPMDVPYGWVMLDLWHANLTHAQAWVQVRFTAAGTFFAGHRALAADDLCVFGP